MDQLQLLLQKLYPGNADAAVSAIKVHRETLAMSEKPLPNTNWYQFINMYFIYPDAITGRKGNSLTRLKEYLPTIKELGCDAVHILPFLKSPMVDRGFDVSDYFSVRQELGSLSDIRSLMKKANQEGLKLFMDLVLNHVSDQHEWFQKAESGDEQYRKYFIYQKTKPEFIKKIHKESAVWAQYKVNGKYIESNIAFPEYTGKIPHWRQGKDGYWYYHTYYPNQLDVNWRNPEVFVEFAKIIMYWGAMGFNFRLDAIPFVGKSAYKEVDNNSEFMRNLMASLTLLVESISPESVLIVETYEKSKTVIEYFGDTNRKQAKLGYNFHLCTQLWVSLVTKDATRLNDVLNALKNIPVHAEWLNFLRNHDELSLAYLDDKTLTRMKKSLFRYGKPFREGYGISGRTYSLLGNDERRFLSAYFLLSSLPGGMLLPYGDEFGKVNLTDNELTEKERNDTRNINRGVLTKKEMNSIKGKRINKRIKGFLAKRKHLQEFTNVWPQVITLQPEVFGCVYKSGSSQLVILVNISEKRQKVAISTKDFLPVNSLWEVKTEEEEITLSPYAAIWIQK